MNWDWLQFLLSDPAVRTWLIWAMGAGMGVIITFIIDWIKSTFNPSPRTTRVVVFAVCILIPSAIYALYCFVGAGPFLLSQLIGAIMAAFAASQVMHTRELPTGADLARAALANK